MSTVVYTVLLSHQIHTMSRIQCDEMQIQNTEGNLWAIESADVISKDNLCVFDVFGESG